MRTIVFFSLCLLAAAPAHGETVTGTIPVSLTVLPACRVETAPLTFTATPGSDAAAQTPIEVACSSDTAVALSLDSGQNALGGRRHLSGAGGAVVPDKLYTDAAGTRAWGGVAINADVAAGQPLALLAYGRIEGPATLVAAGEYRDTVTVTLAF